MSNGHIRPRGKGAWELKFDIGLDPLTGRRVTKYVTVKGAKRDAQRELRRRLDAVDQGLNADPGKLTVGDWLTKWLDLARNEVSPKTAASPREGALQRCGKDRGFNWLRYCSTDRAWRRPPRIGRGPHLVM